MKAHKRHRWDTALIWQALKDSTAGREQREDEREFKDEVESVFISETPEFARSTDPQ